MQALLQVLNLESEYGSSLSFRDGKTWQTLSWVTFKNLAWQYAYALDQMGLGKGQRMGILAPSSPHWLCMDLAAQILGAEVVPLLNTLSAAQLQDQIAQTELQWLYLDYEDLEPVKLAICSQIPHLFHLRNNENLPGSFLALGPLPNEEWKNSKISQHNDFHCNTIVFTSGTEGNSKGVQLCPHHFYAQIQCLSELFPLRPFLRALSVLPLDHVFERTVCYYLLSRKAHLYFADDPKKTGIYLHEIRAQICSIVPRILEKMQLKFKETAVQKPWPSRLLLQAALNYAQNSKPPHSILHHIWDFLVYRKVRAKMGNCLEYLIVGGAYLDPKLNQCMQNIGLPIFEGYGMSECAPILSCNAPGQSKIGSVGKPLSSMKLKFAADGEILCKGENLMLGYLHTGLPLDPEGFFGTGDYGVLDQDGYLWLKGRKKELCKSSGGKYIAPVPIEQALVLHCPGIEFALVIADQKPFVCALLFSDSLLPYTFVDHSFSEEHLLQGIALVNSRLNEWEKIRKWILVPRERPLSPEDLNAKQGLKRENLHLKYADLIQNFYR